VDLAVVINPRGQTLVGEYQLVVDAQLVGDSDDGGLGGEGVGAFFPEEPVGGAVGADVASEVGAGFGEEEGGWGAVGGLVVDVVGEG